MKRDLNLIRLILLAVENNTDPQQWIDPEPEGYDHDAVCYHIMLMDQAGLLEGLNRSAIGIFRWSARNLTWKGHETLEAARDEAVWQKTINTLAETSPGLVFDVLNEVLVAEGRRQAHSAGTD